jgi:hypothetical protein
LTGSIALAAKGIVLHQEDPNHAILANTDSALILIIADFCFDVAARSVRESIPY